MFYHYAKRTCLITFPCNIVKLCFSNAIQCLGCLSFVTDPDPATTPSVWVLKAVANRFANTKSRIWRSIWLIEYSYVKLSLDFCSNSPVLLLSCTFPLFKILLGDKTPIKGKTEIRWLSSSRQVLAMLWVSVQAEQEGFTNVSSETNALVIHSSRKAFNFECLISLRACYWEIFFSLENF